MSPASGVISWQLVNHPTLKKPIALVGIGNDEALVIFPFYDLRDFDFNGKLSVKERVGSHVPVFGPQMVKSSEALLLRSIAIDIADPALKQKADLTLIRAGYVAVVQQIQTLYIKNLVGGGLGLALEKTSLTIVSKYFVKKAFEQTLSAMLKAAMGH